MIACRVLNFVSYIIAMEVYTMIPMIYITLHIVPFFMDY